MGQPEKLVINSLVSKSHTAADVTSDDRGSGGKNVIFSNGPRVNSEYPNPFR